MSTGLSYNELLDAIVLAVANGSNVDTTNVQRALDQQTVLLQAVLSELTAIRKILSTSTGQNVMPVPAFPIGG